ncbi:MAG: hypothetical protein QG608_2324 [Actinomycetota bacterium]|nr:hypothetical protein [Actinomycetota bacterium]
MGAPGRLVRGAHCCPGPWPRNLPAPGGVSGAGSSRGFPAGCISTVIRAALIHPGDGDGTLGRSVQSGGQVVCFDMDRRRRPFRDHFGRGVRPPFTGWSHLLAESLTEISRNRRVRYGPGREEPVRARGRCRRSRYSKRRRGVGGSAAKGRPGNLRRGSECFLHSVAPGGSRPKQGEGAGPSPPVSSNRTTSRTVERLNGRGTGSFDHGQAEGHGNHDAGGQCPDNPNASPGESWHDLRVAAVHNLGGKQPSDSPRPCRLTRTQLLSRVSNNRPECLMRTGRRRQRAYLDI